MKNTPIPCHCSGWFVHIPMGCNDPHETAPCIKTQNLSPTSHNLWNHIPIWTLNPINHPKSLWPLSLYKDPQETMVFHREFTHSIGTVSLGDGNSAGKSSNYCWRIQTSQVWWHHFGRSRYLIKSPWNPIVILLKSLWISVRFLFFPFFQEGNWQRAAPFGSGVPWPRSWVCPSWRVSAVSPALLGMTSDDKCWQAGHLQMGTYHGSWIFDDLWVQSNQNLIQISWSWSKYPWSWSDWNIWNQNLGEFSWFRSQFTTWLVTLRTFPPHPALEPGTNKGEWYHSSLEDLKKN